MAPLVPKFSVGGAKPSNARRYAIALAGIVLLSVSAAAWRHRQNLKSAASTPKISPPVAAVPAGPQLPEPPGILIHHSDTPAKMHGVTFNAAVLDRIARQRGFSVVYEGKTYHISYHYVILPDGTVQTGRPEHCQGAHCPKFNNWLGICLIGDFQKNSHWWPTTPTDPQKRALITLCESLMSKYHIAPENVRRHRDVHMTYCPGSEFPYHDIITELRSYSLTHPETRAPHPQPTVIASAPQNIPKKQTNQ